MSQSLAPECTPLKHAYDSCFNTWFAGYLQPQVSAEGKDAKVKEYELKCGKVWNEYRDCLQKAVKEKGLNDLLERAKEENPLLDMASVDDDSR